MYAGVQTDATPPGTLHILCKEHMFGVRVTIIAEKKQ